MKKSMSVGLLIIVTLSVAGCLSLKPEFGASPAKVKAVQTSQVNYEREFGQYQLANTLLNVCIDIFKVGGVWPTAPIEQVRLTREYTDQIVAMLNAGLTEEQIIEVFQQTVGQAHDQHQ